MTWFLELGSGISSILHREVILSAITKPTSWFRKATQIKWGWFATHNFTMNVLKLTWTQNEFCATQKYSNWFNAFFFKMMSIWNFVSSNGNLYPPSLVSEVLLHCLINVCSFYGCVYEILSSGTLSVCSTKAHLKVPYWIPCSVALYDSTTNISYLVIIRYSPRF